MFVCFCCVVLAAGTVPLSLSRIHGSKFFVAAALSCAFVCGRVRGRLLMMIVIMMMMMMRKENEILQDGNGNDVCVGYEDLVCDP